jgi:hypothetical protein
LLPRQQQKSYLQLLEKFKNYQKIKNDIFKLKKTLIIFAFLAVLSNSCVLPKHNKRIGQLCHAIWDSITSGANPHIPFLKAMSIDSTFYEPYYLNGLAYSWDYTVSRDTTAFKLSIENYYKCIQIKYKYNRILMDTMIRNSILRIEPKNSGRLGENNFDDNCYPVIQGIYVLLNNPDSTAEAQTCTKWKELMNKWTDEYPELKCYLSDLIKNTCNQIITKN